MAQFAAALQSLSSASCWLGQQPGRVSSAMVGWKVTAPPLRLQTVAIRCHVEDLSPKELHHIRKKETQKELRKLRKERRSHRRAEELARMPKVNPNPAILKFRKPLLNWNKPWKKRSASNGTEKAQRGLGFEQKEGTPRFEADSSPRGRNANSELPGSLWREFETIYEEKMKKVAERIADGGTLTDSADGSRYAEEAFNMRLSISSDSGAEFTSQSMPGNVRLDRDLSRNAFERSSGSTNVIREDRIAAGKASTRGVARIVIGERQGKKVYLSMGDADAAVRKELPRSEVDEDKQLEWLVKQLNTVARPDGVHLSRVIRSGGLKITDGRSVVLVQKLGALGNWKCALQVVEWLSSRHRFPPLRSRYLYTTLLAVLGKARRPIESLNIINAMRENLATYPDMPAYRIIAVTLGQAGHLEELLELMQTLRRGPDMIHKDLELADKGRLKPDTVVFNAALNACVTLRHWRLALWILDQIQKEKDTRPNSASYGLAIEVMVKAGKLDLAWKLLTKMELEGFFPNSLTYKTLVEGLGQVGNADLAVRMVKQMEERGIVAVSGVYYALASTLCACGKWQDALLQVDRIGSLSGRPLVQTYTGLIKACKERGHWKDSISVFEHMREVCFPNIGTCNIMISLYGAHMMYDEAKKLFDEVKKGRIYSPKLHRNNPRLAPDAFTYDAMLGACTNSQKWEDLEVLLRQMLLQGYQLDSNRHAWIVQSLSEAGQDDLVAAMFTNFRTSKSATAEMYFLMIKSCLRGGEQDKAFSHLEEMVNLNLRVSSSDVQKLERLVLLLSEEDRSIFMNKVESLKNTSDFDFTNDRSRLFTQHQQRSSTFKTRDSVLNTSYGSRGMNSRGSLPGRLQNASLALGSSQDKAFDGADLHTSKDCQSDDVKGDHRMLKCQSDVGFQSTFRPSDIPGWELLWKRSSYWQPTSNKSHLVEQLT